MQISVAIATFNGIKYLDEQLESVLACLEPGDEVIVSDHGSTDGTLERLRCFEECNPSFHVYHCPRETTGNKIARNFQNAANHCKKEIIVLCDQDDIWLPSRLSQVRSLHSEFDVVVVDGQILCGKKDFHPSIFESKPPSSSFLRNFYKLSILGCQLSFRRDFIDTIPDIPKNVHITHDWWWYIHGTLFGSIGKVCEPCFFYRRHDENASPGLGQSPNSLWRKIYIRLLMIATLYRHRR